NRSKGCGGRDKRRTQHRVADIVPPTAGTGMRTSARHVTIALVAVSIILAAYTADRAWAWRSEVNSQHARDAAIAAASAEVTRLITVSDRNAATSIPALLDGATASFQANLKADAAQLRKALAAERVLASGTVASAGIGTSTSDTATVYVAADGT